MHVRFGYVFDDDGNIPVPRPDRLVIRSRHEPAILIYEGDRVDSTEVLVVFLGDLAGGDVVL